VAGPFIVKIVRYLLTLGLCLAGSLACAQDAANVARHAPADACLALVSGDVGQTCEAFQRTRLGETFCGPDFTPLIDELRRRGMAGPLYLRPAVGFDWSDLAKVHDAGALVVFPLAEDKLGMAWIFSAATPSAAPELLAVSQRYFAAQKFRRTTARHKAARLIVLQPARDDSTENPRVLFVGADFYGIANSPEAADAVLNLAADRSLAAGELWRESQTAAGTAAASNAGDATVIVRPMELWELVRRDAERKKPPEEAGSADAKPAAKPGDKDKKEEPKRDPLASSRHLGFGGVQALAGRVSFPAEDSLDWQLQLQLVAPRPFDKALRMLELQQGPMPELPDWVGADVTSASFWRWNFPLAMRGFGNLFDEANEPGPDGVGLFEDMLDGLRDDPEGVRVDLRREVFEHLGPELFNVTDRRGPRTEELPEGDRSLYVARVRDVEHVTGALTRFYRGDDRVRHSQSGNYKVWTVPEGASLFVEGESDSVVSVRALAIGEGRMLFGTDVDMLHAALAASPDSPRLKDDAAWSGLWNAMRERHGEQGALWALTRLDQVMEPAYRRATSGEKKETDDDGLLAALWRIVLFGTADKEADVPSAAAPPFDRLRASLPAAGTTISQAESGFSIHTGALRGAGAP
jgi:hypothetical protein